MGHFLIYTNRNKDNCLAMTRRIESYLTQRGQTVTLRVPKKDEKQKSREGRAEADCMIVLGGDGTMLQAAREMRRTVTPMIGVNLGTLGYLTEVEPGALEQALERIIAGDYQKERRMMLKGRVLLQDGRTEEDLALNDIVISRSGSLQIIQLNLLVNGQFLCRYSADGVIVTTPTGSTGYNLSAGGPLVDPKAKLMMLTPICPHSLNKRSIIFSSEDVIEIEIPAGRDGGRQTVDVNFDGNHVISLVTGDKILVEKSEVYTEFIRLNQVNFLDVLHKKMSEN